MGFNSGFKGLNAYTAWHICVLPKAIILAVNRIFQPLEMRFQVLLSMIMMLRRLMSVSTTP